MTNWDGNHLRGNFYSFQVGTVTFISLDADDVIYQDGGSAFSVEDAPWSAATNAGDADGYAVFDVDPGARRGETTITCSTSPSRP